MLNPMDIFGKSFDCDCGRTHEIQPREIVYETGALGRLPEVCARATKGRRVAVIMDARTQKAAGHAACEALRGAGWRATPLLVPDPPGHSPDCDDPTHKALAERCGDQDLFVSVGSGVMTDLTRWLARDAERPFVSFATAASMNGYASANVSVAIRGVKTLMWARPPVAIVSDPAVLARAPWEMTAAGLGDVLAKPVSGPDWKLGNILFGDYYCAQSVNLITAVERQYMERPEALRAGEPGPMEALFHALLLGGAAMNMAGTSSPCSGAEHLIGHTLDMMATRDGAPHDLHGRQIGITSVIASELYRRVLEAESPLVTEPKPGPDPAFWGSLAESVREFYKGKDELLETARKALVQPGAWDRVRTELAPMVMPPAALRDCLKRAGAAWRAEDIGCDRARLTQALTHAHEMRARFTVLDLARMAGVLPGAAEEIVEAWA